MTDVPDYFDNKIQGMWFAGQGRVVHTHGDQKGAEGITNAQGQVKNIWDAPVKTMWKTTAHQDGSTQKRVKRLHRDMDLGFNCVATQANTMEENESEFRKMFAYEVDEWDDDPEPTTLHILTAKSGERKIDVLLYEAPEFNPDIDPIAQQYANLILPLRAGQPDWYETPTEANGGISIFESSAQEASGTVTVYNPTDRVCRQIWILTRAKWVLPDYSWRGGRYNRRPGGTYGNRVIQLPEITEVQGGAVINLDAKELLVRDAHGTNMLPLLEGKYFMHEIPPYTPRTEIPVYYTDAPEGGARCELIMERRWSAPWGRE